MLDANFQMVKQGARDTVRSQRQSAVAEQQSLVQRSFAPDSMVVGVGAEDQGVGSQLDTMVVSFGSEQRDSRKLDQQQFGGSFQQCIGANFFNLNSASFCHLDDVDNLLHNPSINLHNNVSILPCSGVVGSPNSCGTGDRVEGGFGTQII